MTYKYELHCHTGRVSLCASIEPKALVRKYEAAGYSGLVLTDHYSPMTFMAHHFLCPRKAADHYLSAYRELKDWVGDSFTVLLGMELRRYGQINDYLIYGVDEDWFYRPVNMLAWSPARVFEETQRHGLLVYEAHPYRRLRSRCDITLLDGVEGLNGHTDAPRNRKALAWAARHGKPVISGGDTHHETDVPGWGIETEVRIRDNADLLRVLRQGLYTPLDPQETK